MLRDQAKLLRDLAGAPGQFPEVRERIHKLARDCEELVHVLERSLQTERYSGNHYVDHTMSGKTALPVESAVQRKSRN